MEPRVRATSYGEAKISDQQKIQYRFKSNLMDHGLFFLHCSHALLSDQHKFLMI